MTMGIKFRQKPKAVTHEHVPLYMIMLFFINNLLLNTHAVVIVFG